MSIAVTDKSTVHIFWSVRLSQADVIGVVLKDSDTSPWRSVFRTRFYRDDKFWDSKDDKDWYYATADETEVARDALVATIDMCCDKFKEMFTNDSSHEPYTTRAVLNCDGNGFANFMANQDFTSSRAIFPTHSCFDDALEYLDKAARHNLKEAETHLRLVHAVCLVPEGPEIGHKFAHAWIERDRWLCIQAGLIDGQKLYYGVKRKELYATLRVQLSTTYTVAQALQLNWESNHYGPWEQVYRALCGGRKVFREHD